MTAVGRRLPAVHALLAVLCLFALPAAADELSVAVAANFLGTLQEQAPQFEQASGDKLVLSSGSSGQFLTQIEQGAPFDVFLSADSERPRRLEAEGLAVSGSRFTYAIGTLVLWSPMPGVVDAEGKVLQVGQFRFIALADPHNAPYGAAAQQVLTALGVWDKLNHDKRIVLGENITQAWQFAATGNVELAFVALSQVVAGNGTVSGSHWLPPQSLYARIDQDAVILAHSTKRAAAERFIKWLRTDPGTLAAIRSAGYRTPN
jgi:molybdate transport system substrate-binding protein